jgi:tetratricopeptide (TPR) repeat protein
MGARRLLAVAIATLAASAAATSSFQASQAPASQTSTPDQSQGTPAAESSSKTVHTKTGPNSSRTVRHVRAPAEGTAPPELTRAEELIQKADYAAAEPLLQKVVEHDAANYVAWFDLGFVQNNLGKISDSIVAYRKSVGAKPDVFESNLNLGLQLAKTGDPEAEHFLRTATALKPTGNPTEGLFRAWLSLGHVLEKSKPDEALTAYRQASTLQPADPEPRLAAGQMLEQENKFADAEAEYKQALALDPASDALIGLANVYMRGRRFVEAEEYLRRLVTAHPDKAAAHVQLGRVLAAEGKNDQAIAELQLVAKSGTADPSVQRDLADLYLTGGKNGEAESAYRTLLATTPNDFELHHGLGKALLRQKKYPEAEKEFLVTVKLKPDMGEAYSDLAFAANENKEYPLTIKALDARAKLMPEVPVTHFLRATALDRLHAYKEAAVSYHLFLNTANGKYPDQEWQAKHRLIAIEPKK